MTDDTSRPAADGAAAGQKPALRPRPPLQAPTLEPRLAAAAGGVTVRMYRQGLGDCFLLAFPTPDPAQPYYMLIDCGVLQGAPNAAANMNAVAKSIQSATGGHIHLLVVTHRHADHISGFQLADDIFKEMTVDNLWLSWAEKPDDPVAQKLWKRSGQALATLNEAVTSRPAALEGVAGVLEFAGGLMATWSDPLQPIRQLLRPGSAPEYLRGGAGPLSLPPVPGSPAAGGARLYVLGPPSSLDALAQMDPAGGSQETYLAASGLNAALAFMFGGPLQAAGNVLSEDDAALRDLSYPFPKSLHITPAEARESPFFRNHYGFDDAPPTGDRPGHQVPPLPPAWSRIDDDWLASGEELALQLDNCVNNTSLVLAIELLPSRKVLTFVGDAQVGNWLSWHDLPAWSVDGQAEKVSVADLLARTVLYKVGHHGSHNATVAALADNTPWGLPLMASPELIALLPVDEEYATVVRRWAMPWPKMLAQLTHQTQQRILRLDKGRPQVDPATLGQSDRAAWAAFAGRVRETDLYLEVDVP